jgi:hypothetical protein
MRGRGGSNFVVTPLLTALSIYAATFFEWSSLVRITDRRSARDSKAYSGGWG